MICEARRQGDEARIDALLEKRANVDEMHAFLKIAFADDLAGLLTHEAAE
jgi:hypothetical protein